MQQAWVIAAMVILAAAIPGLGYVGFRKVFNTTSGRKIDAQNDPTKPNYEANVAPTPVMLLAQTNADGVTAVTVLSLGGGDTGGGVLFIPVNTVTAQLTTSSSSTSTSAAVTTTTTTTTTKPSSAKTTTLAATYRASGAADLGQLAANVVGVSFSELVLMSDEQLAAFIAPVTPLTIDNPDRLVEVDSANRTQTVFAAGRLTLDGAGVARYLTIRNPQESDLNRLSRHQLVWQAWLAAVRGSSNPNAVPGETTSGLGRYVRGLAKGTVQFATLPVTPQSTSGTETFAPDANRIAALMTSIVPLPTPASPGDRVRVRLLSGVGPVNIDQLLSSSLVTADAQITIVGNADRFDYADTQIVYYDDAFASAAAALQQLFGVGNVTKSTTPADSEDVTVIIGKDLVDKRGLLITTGSSGG